MVFTQAGIPLNVTMVVLDGRNTTAQQCIPLADVKVDIWNCNWDGVYSDESSEDTTGVIYLRGYQLTNDSGAVLFQTLYPGHISLATLKFIQLFCRSPLTSVTCLVVRL